MAIYACRAAVKFAGKYLWHPGYFPACRTLLGLIVFIILWSTSTMAFQCSAREWMSHTETLLKCNSQTRRSAVHRPEATPSRLPLCSWSAEEHGEQNCRAVQVGPLLVQRLAGDCAPMQCTALLSMPTGPGAWRPGYPNTTAALASSLSIT